MSDHLTRLAFGAVADPDDLDGLEQVKQHTHDQLIAELGEYRDGPIGWSIYDASPGLERLAMLRSFDRDADYSGLEEFLRENPTGLLVIASANVKPGWGP